MKAITLRTTLSAISGVCFACTVTAVASIAPARAIAQGLSLGQSHSSGMNGMNGTSSSARMGSSSGTGLSSQGSGLGRSSSSMGGGLGGTSGGFGQRSSGGSAMGSSTGGMAGSRIGSSNPGKGSSGKKASKLTLKPASDAMADSSSTHSMYDYNYGAEDTGRNTDTLYKSRVEVPPTDNYKFGATNPQ